MSKKPSQHPPYADMLFEAIHSAGRGYMISRQRIIKFIDENFAVDTASGPFKSSFKKALEKKLEDGLVAQDKQSFYFTGAGQAAFDDMYDSDEPATNPRKSTQSRKESEAQPAAGKKKSVKK
ncbi:hypothetical protein JCM5296_003798 [Sporobolomyces johnsonii]